MRPPRTETVANSTAAEGRELAEAELCYADACSKLAARDVSSALEFFKRAESLGWDADICAAGRWDCHMFLGDFESAWRESDAICNRGAPDPHRLWDGLPFTNRHVVLRCLHGLGDTIQFIRYAPLIRAQASSLTVEVPARLISLIRTVSGIDDVISWEVPRNYEPRWNQQIEIMEVPRAFRTTIETVPGRNPYLSVQQSISERCARRWNIHGDFRVGLVWASGSWDTSRSMPLELLVPLFEMEEVSFFSLQAGVDQEQLLQLPSSCVCGDLVDSSITPLETAAQISNLDLVITVDTMVAHLAGALGRPVWLMLSFASDWRWMLHRADSPWYPTMRIFRQPRPGDWASVVQNVGSALDQLSSQRLSRTAMSVPP